MGLTVIRPIEKGKCQVNGDSPLCLKIIIIIMIISLLKVGVIDRWRLINAHNFDTIQ